MPYDPDLAERIRQRLAVDLEVREKRMFGGLAFLVAGHMAVAASSKGGLMVRVDPESADELSAAPGVEPMVMRGRPIAGWLHVGPDAVLTERDLARWVDIGGARARSLPPKPDA